MIKYSAIAFLSVFAILSSCTEAQEEPSTQKLLEEIKETEAQLSDKILNQDEKILFWKNMLNQERYASDRVAKAIINYYIAKSFGRLNIDSAEMYATKALILIDGRRF